MMKLRWPVAWIAGKAGVPAVRIPSSAALSGVDWSSRRPATGMLKLDVRSVARAAGTAVGNPIGLPEASTGAAAAIFAPIAPELSPLQRATLFRMAAPPQALWPALDWNRGEL